LADLIEGGLGEGERAAVLLPASEPESPADSRLGVPTRWRRLIDQTVEAELPTGATHVFFVVDGRRSPVDQVEAFKAWLDSRGAEVARVLCVVDCRLAEQHPKLMAWFEACIHFSDVVLLNHREGISNRWMADFQEKFHAKFFPCLFEFVKEGRVKNPALVLAPVAHRISHVFDEPEWVPADDEADDDDDEVEMTAEVDPYLERRAGGRRVKELPHIEDFLPKSG
jgi:hypothetical protein